MRYSLTVSTAPTAEPLTTAEAKSHLRVETDMTEDDTLIASYVKAAREWYEDAGARALITQTHTLRLDGFPGSSADPRAGSGDCGINRHAILLPRAPVASVTSVAYVDVDGATQTLVANTDYVVDIYGLEPRIVPAYGTVWPEARAQPNSVTIVYVAGYGAAGSYVPESIRSLLRLLVAHQYELREPVVVGTIANELPLGVQSLLWQTRNPSFAS